MHRVIAVVCLLASSGAATAGPLAFEGRWDCDGATFTFTGATFDNGSEELEILDIAPDGDDFVLTFADDYQLSLTMNGDGTMSWFSAVTGESFACAPLP